MADPVPIAYAGFEGRGLALRPTGLLKGAAILCNGQPAPKIGRTFTVNDNAGAPVTFQLKGAFFDPIPAVQVVGGPLIRLAPAFAWYEYVWIALPLALIAVGGALGAFCGIVAAYFNAQILRSQQPVALRYLFSFLVMIAAVAVWLGIAILIASGLHGG
jgi:hypothetical protein